MLIDKPNSRVVHEQTRPLHEVVKESLCACLIETIILGSAAIVALLATAFIGLI